MKNTFIVVASLLVLVAVVWTSYAFLQSSSSVKQKSYRIGIIVRGDSYTPAVTGIKERMTEMGYIEGTSVTYDVVYVVNPGDIASTTAKIIAEKPDLIVTFASPISVEAAKQTKTIPIVFGSMGDPLGSGIIDSMTHPGRNVTGITSLSVDLTPKRLDMLKQLFPSIKKVAFPYTLHESNAERSLQLTQDLATRLGVTVVPYPLTPDHLAVEVAKSISRKDVDAIMFSADSAVWAALSTFVDQARKEKIPLAVFDRSMVEKGGLVGYGPDYAVMGKQIANIVKKILNGASPADLPIESPEKLILALNLKTAKELGLTVPSVFLSQVDYLVQ